MTIKLTKREQDIVLRAAEQIADRTSNFLCVAIHMQSGCALMVSSRIVDKLVQFCGPTQKKGIWEFSGHDTPEGRDERTLMLLTFLEACS